MPASTSWVLLEEVGVHFGWYLNPPTSGREHDGRHIQEVVDQCVLAEQLGFKAVWITEHHFTEYNTYSDCLIMAAYLASQTPTLRLGFSLAVLPLHHPIRFAEQCSLIDQLSKGKLIVGIGSGYGPSEFEGFGLDIKDRHELFDEAADLLFSVWQHPGGTFTYATPRYQGRMEGRIIPASFQQPHPMIARGTVSAEYAEAWGAKGQPILHAPFGPEHVKKIVDAHHRGLAQAQVPEEQRAAAKEWSAMVLNVHVGETDEEAESAFQPYVNKHLVEYYLANRGQRVDYEQLPPEFVQRWNRTQKIVGSPETVAAQIRPYAALGISHIMTWMNLGGIPHELVTKSQRLFGERVIPLLADA